MTLNSAARESLDHFSIICLFVKLKCVDLLKQTTRLFLRTLMLVAHLLLIGKNCSCDTPTVVIIVYMQTLTNTKAVFILTTVYKYSKIAILGCDLDLHNDCSKVKFILKQTSMASVIMHFIIFASNMN